MNPVDVKETLDGLPFKKTATPQQNLLLIFCVLFIFASGGGFAIFAWSSRNDIVNAIGAVDAKVTSVKASQEWMRKSTVSRSEFVTWAISLDQKNRESLPKLIVPIPAVDSSNGGHSASTPTESPNN